MIIQISPWFGEGIDNYSILMFNCHLTLKLMEERTDRQMPWLEFWGDVMEARGEKTVYNVDHVRGHQSI